MSVAYRDSCLPTKVANSSDEGELSDSDSEEEGAVWQSKRTKIAATPAPVLNDRNLGTQNFRRRSKNAQLWGSVLTQQSSNDISSSLGAVGMTRYVSRGPESFDYSSAFNDKTQEKSSNMNLDDSADEKVDIEVNESSLNTEKASVLNKRKRKQQKREKSKNTPTYEPGQPRTLNRQCEISGTDLPEKVAEEVAFRLWERKRSLIRDITEYLGSQKTIEMYNKTEDIEKNGGLLINNGLRRRTPGGTFLHLIRNDLKFDQDGITKIFEKDWERERLGRKPVKKMTTDDKEEDQTTTAKNDVMDCNDVISTTDESQELRKPLHALGGAIESIGENEEEASDGEIVDSDGAGDVRNEPETFG